MSDSDATKAPAAAPLGGFEGEIFRLDQFKGNGLGWNIERKASLNRYVVLVIGLESKDAPGTFDVDAAMARLGWVRAAKQES